MEFPCPYLDADVELTDERMGHIASRHPDLPLDNFDLIRHTLYSPDMVSRRPKYPNTRLISRWFPSLLNGKWVIVAVVTDAFPHLRHWIVTARIGSQPPKGEIEWPRI